MLALALRQSASNTADVNSREKLMTEATQLCEEAIQLDPTDEQAWLILGNSYLGEFFTRGQCDAEMMVGYLTVFHLFILLKKFFFPYIHPALLRSLPYLSDIC